MVSPFAFGAANNNGVPTAQLKIHYIYVDFLSNTLYIDGINFTKAKGVPVVTLKSRAEDIVLKLVDAPPYTDTTLQVNLPSGYAAGDYLLTISTGSSTTDYDEYNLTIGAVGPQGPKGDVGLTGPQGPQGVQGPIGPKGPQGPKGDTGATGATGPQGLQGIQGIQGLKGDKGDQGIQGLQGDQGIPGPKGDQGPEGLVWLGEWNSGTAYNVRDAVTYEGSSYVATANNTGSQPSPDTKIWNILAKKGDQGATGAAGPQGLQGPKGDTGATGATGPQGPQGPSGAAGPQGLQGLQGMQGPKGDTGAMGPIGLTGPKGDTGPAGNDGAAGKDGLPGATGAPGPVGPQGPKGAPAASYVSGLVSLIPAFSTCVNGDGEITCENKSMIGVTVVDNQVMEFDVQYVSFVQTAGGQEATQTLEDHLRLKIYKGRFGSVSIEVLKGDVQQTSFSVSPGRLAKVDKTSAHQISATLNSDSLLTLTLDRSQITAVSYEASAWIKRAFFSGNAGSGGSALVAEIQNVGSVTASYIVGIQCDGGEPPVSQSMTLMPQETGSFNFQVGSAVTYCYVTLYARTGRVYDEVRVPPEQP
jgi:hypothetical protein